MATSRQQTGSSRGHGGRTWYSVIWRLSRSAGVGKASHPAFLIRASMVWLTVHPSASATCGAAATAAVSTSHRLAPLPAYRCAALCTAELALTLMVARHRARKDWQTLICVSDNSRQMNENCKLMSPRRRTSGRNVAVRGCSVAGSVKLMISPCTPTCSWKSFGSGRHDATGDKNCQPIAAGRVRGGAPA